MSNKRDSDFTEQPSQRRRRSAVVGLLPWLLVACLRPAIALAGGVPTSEPLTYSGVLTDSSGTPVNGIKDIDVRFWDAADTGQLRCSVSQKQLTLAGGSFRITLPDDCVAAVHTYPDLWAEVIVSGLSLGRVKLGAVPYALEAHSLSGGAVSATSVQAPSIQVAGKDVLASVTTGTSLTGKGTAQEPLAVNYAGTGTAASAAHSDHVHATNGSLTGKGTAQEPLAVNYAGTGTAASAARSDHVHATNGSLGGTGTTQDPYRVAFDANGTALTAAHSDHAHAGMMTAVATNATLSGNGTAANPLAVNLDGTGTAKTAAHSDHVHNPASCLWRKMGAGAPLSLHGFFDRLGGMCLANEVLQGFYFERAGCDKSERWESGDTASGACATMDDTKEGLRLVFYCCKLY